MASIRRKSCASPSPRRRRPTWPTGYSTTLAAWTALDDTRSTRRIGRDRRRRRDVTRRRTARRLFAVALETPGGLKVQTIHAFCTRLLQQFPFEANVAARFDVLEETEQNAAPERDQPRRSARCSRRTGSAAGPSARDGDCDRRRSDFQGRGQRGDPQARHGTRLDRSQRLYRGGHRRALAGRSASRPRTPSNGSKPRSLTGRICPCRSGPPSPKCSRRARRATRTRHGALWPHRGAAGSPRTDIYLQYFSPTSGEPRARLISKAIETGDPELAERLSSERTRILALCERRRAIACRDRTKALVTIADAIISRYRRRKNRRGLLDYDDLIDKTLALLSEERARLGALQARSGHRPCPHRRGAGYEPEAMGDHPAADG